MQIIITYALATSRADFLQLDSEKRSIRLCRFVVALIVLIRSFIIRIISESYIKVVAIDASVLQRRKMYPWSNDFRKEKAR